MIDHARPQGEGVKFATDNLVMRLLRWERERPSSVAYRYLLRGEEESHALTWSELAVRARGVASELLRLVRRRERVLLLLEPGLDFVVAFLGSWLAGVVPVPLAPPRPREDLKKLDVLTENCEPSLLLTSARLHALLGPRAAETRHFGRLRVLVVDAPPVSARSLPPPKLDPTELAFLQYTSGSTGTPKGVAVTHGNVLANERMMVEAFGQTQASVIVGWLPLYHDMGLIGNVLVPLYLGAECVLMSPVDFIVRPARWLRAIARYQATTSGGPNFAYDLCSERVRPEELAGVDLSSWTVAFSGAEPVRAPTLERFTQSFAAYGFSARSFAPCYGLAECTLFAAGRAHQSGSSALWVDNAALEEHRVELAAPASPAARSVVSCGRLWNEQELAIVHPTTRERAGPREVGELWIRGPHVAAGYFRNPERTEAAFRASLAGEAEPYLRTGDLGFMHEGELYVTGRLTEMIIVRGRNYYAEDIELTARAADPALSGGTRTSAFGRERGGAEALVIVQEVRREELTQLSPQRMEELALRIRSAVGDEHGIQPSEVVLVKPGSIPCTTSGKVRRRECRALHERRELAYLTTEPDAPECPRES